MFFKRNQNHKATLCGKRRMASLAGGERRKPMGHGDSLFPEKFSPRQAAFAWASLGLGSSLGRPDPGIRVQGWIPLSQCGRCGEELLLSQIDLLLWGDLGNCESGCLRHQSQRTGAFEITCRECVLPGLCSPLGHNLAPFR